MGGKDAAIRAGLQEWSVDFNENWVDEPGVGFSFLVHDGPESVIRHKIDWESRGGDDIEELRDRPISVLLSYRNEDVYESPLMNKQFMKMMKKEFSYSI